MDPTPKPSMVMDLGPKMYSAYRDTQHKDVARYITVRGQYEGFHKYEDAPDDVAFLKHSHRHLFKWDAVIEVFHEDRELEFFIVKRHIEDQILPFTMSHDLGSCETQAEIILEGLVNTYGPSRFYSVSVSEDGENDGTIEWFPTNGDA